MTGASQFLLSHRCIALAVMLCAMALKAGEPAPPPPAIAVSAQPGDYYKAKVKTAYNDGAATAQQELVIFGASESPVEFKLSLTAHGGERKVRIDAKVTDFYGAEVPEGNLAADISLKPGPATVKIITAKPLPEHAGPYLLSGTWSESTTKANGTIEVRLAQANSRLMLNDFEAPFAKDPAMEQGFPGQYHIGNSRGNAGLVVKFPNNKDDAAQPAVSIPLNAKLPGRAVKVGMLMRTPHLPVKVQAQIASDGKETWQIGPMQENAGEWRYVQIPLPTVKTGTKLTLQHISITGPAGHTVYVDDIDVWTQHDAVADFDAAEGHAKVAYSYSGSKFHPGGGQEPIRDRTGKTYVFPQAGKPIELTLTASAFGADRSFKFSAKVSDYNGAALPGIDVEIPVKKGERATKTVAINPTEAQQGPFFIEGAFTEATTGLKDPVSFVCAQANQRLVINDFELVKYADAGSGLENSSSAKHRGEMGLIVRPQAQPDAHGKPQAAKQTLPLGISLTGRPVKVGMWLKASASGGIAMQLRDPGINAMGGFRYDTWTVGPVAFEAGDWRYVEVPMPDYTLPAAKRKSYCESNGIVDYPLTLEHLEITGAANAEVMLDDLELWSQGDKEGSLVLRAVSNKVCNLLYANDQVGVAIGNAWLWGGPLEVKFAAQLEDVTRRAWPIAKDASVTIAPGAEHVHLTALQNLPIGAYRLAAQAAVANRTVATIPPARTADEPVAETTFLVYEPTQKPLPHPELHAMLKDRNKLAFSMGFDRDLRKFVWNSTDGSRSIEMYPGYFNFDWLRPDIKARQDAGLKVIGTLGLTPQFFDPGATFSKNYNEWAGNSTMMPSRSIYFEEYAHRTIEAFADSVDTWIVWESPDRPGFATPEEYTDKMLEVARRAATEANPKAKLVTGAVARDNMLQYITGLVEAGGHQYVDGIGVLPVDPVLSPEDSYLDVYLARAQRILRQDKVKAELWVLNLAWATGDGPNSVSEADQALYIPRAYVMCRSQGVTNILVPPDGNDPNPRRDSADLIYPNGGLVGIKPAALTTQTVKAMLKDAEYLRELFVNDRWDGITRAHLFRRADGNLLLAAWRREGSCALKLPVRPESITDAFGNTVAIDDVSTLALTPAPQYVLFKGVQPEALIKQIERTPVAFEDAPESAWKRGFTFHLDVGNPADEKAAQYASTQSRLVGPVDSLYYSDYGRHVVDSGRHYKGEESFVVDTSKFGGADMMLRKRINYSAPNQLVKVFCNGEVVGQWCSPKRELRYRWRDLEFIVPNRFFASKGTAALKFVAQGDSEATSYYYWAGPIESKTVYVSDLSLLIGSAGGAAHMVSQDKNIIGAPIKLTSKKQATTFAKGIGTNAGAGRKESSMIVLTLNKQFKRLKATVGIDSCTDGKGSVQFFVENMGKQLWSSPAMNAYDNPVELDLDVSGEIVLCLWVSDTGDGPKDDIANWAGLRLELK